VTGPPTCSTCRRADFLWYHVDEPAGPGRTHEQGECFWCSKVAAMRDGGLPVAELEQRPGLTQMLALWDRREEIATARWRGLRELIGDGLVLDLEVTRR